MSTRRMLISFYAVLFAAAVIARAVAGPIADLAVVGKGGLYAAAKAGAPPAVGVPDVQMAVSDASPRR